MSDAGIIAEFLAAVGFKADEKSLDDAMSKVKNFGLAIGAVAAGAAAAIVGIAHEYDQLGYASERLGTSVEKMQELNYVAEQTGSSAEALQSSLTSIFENNPRIKDAGEALEIAGRNMKGMGRAAREAYAANMGIDPSLIPMLISDTSELRSEFAKMYAVAGTDAEAAAKSSRQLINELGKLTTIGKMLGSAVGLAFIDRLRLGVEKLRRGIIENFDKIKTILGVIIDLSMRVVGAIMAFAGRIVGWLMDMVEWFGNLSDAQQKAIGMVGALLGAWRLLNAGFLATPIGWIVAGLAAIIGLIDDYQTYMEGGTSMFNWGPWEDSIKRVVAVLKPIANILLGIVTAIGTSLAPMVEMAINLFGGLAKHVKLVFDLLYALFTGDLQGVLHAAQAIIGNFVDMVKGVFNGLCKVIYSFFTALFPSIEENFPDFAAWAAEAAASIMESFSSVLAWLENAFKAAMDWLPDWAKNTLGLGGNTTGGKPSTPPGQPPLIPPPAMSMPAIAGGGQAVQMEQSNTYHIYSSADPQGVSQAIASRQSNLNAQLVRNTKGAVK
jgi:hypothetical protein